MFTLSSNRRVEFSWSVFGQVFPLRLFCNFFVSHKKLCDEQISIEKRPTWLEVSINKRSQSMFRSLLVRLQIVLNFRPFCPQIHEQYGICQYFSQIVWHYLQYQDFNEVSKYILYFSSEQRGLEILQWVKLRKLFIISTKVRLKLSTKLINYFAMKCRPFFSSSSRVWRVRQRVCASVGGPA